MSPDRPSVTLVDQDNIGWKSWKLIACRLSSLFVAKVHPPNGLLFPQDWGFATPTPKSHTPIAIVSGTGEATDFKFGQNIHMVHPNKSPLKIWEKRERGCIQGLPIFGYPNYLGNGWSYGFQIWQVHSQGSSEQKPTKNFGKKGAWAYPGTAPILRYPQLSQERVKLRTSNSVRIFIASVGIKSHSKFREK